MQLIGKSTIKIASINSSIIYQEFKSFVTKAIR